MTPPPDHTAPAADLHSELLAMLRDLIALTDRLIDGTENDRFDEVTGLTEERQKIVDLLEGMGPRTERDQMAEELRSAVKQLSERSAMLNRTMLGKSETLVSAIHALNQKRFYEQP